MLTDLKRNAHEKQGTLLGEAPDAEQPDYHWGLSFSLEDPELQKVPITADMVGKDIEMEIVAHVKSFSDSEDGKSATLEIRSLGPKAEPSSGREKTLYDD